MFRPTITAALIAVASMAACSEKASNTAATPKTGDLTDDDIAKYALKVAQTSSARSYWISGSYWECTMALESSLTSPAAISAHPTR
jgi:hypothetical protein